MNKKLLFKIIGAVNLTMTKILYVSRLKKYILKPYIKEGSTKIAFLSMFQKSLSVRNLFSIIQRNGHKYHFSLRYIYRCVLGVFSRTVIVFYLHFWYFFSAFFYSLPSDKKNDN